MKVTQRFFNTQKGIGLLELMLSLAIIAILLVMATRYFLVTSRSEQVNRTVTQIGAIQGAVGTWKGGKNSYAGLTEAELYNIGMIPVAEYNNGKIISPWSTPVTVGPSSSDAATSFVITYGGIPGWACNALLAKYPTTQHETPACSSNDPNAVANFTLVIKGA